MPTGLNSATNCFSPRLAANTFYEEVGNSGSRGIVQVIFESLPQVAGLSHIEDGVVVWRKRWLRQTVHTPNLVNRLDSWFVEAVKRGLKWHSLPPFLLRSVDSVQAGLRVLQETKRDPQSPLPLRKSR